ncbi:MAG: hypothetical protein JEZ11_25430 [Desulfobacterales bacterium]|nr:hypothetical protein [Desulfobacterales bacterium]
MGVHPVIRILFRADAYPAIGTGDLMSLVHFSRHPRVVAAGWQCHFMVRDHSTARNLLAGRQVSHVSLIPADASTAEERVAVVRYTADHNMDAVIFEITDRRLDTFDLTEIDAVTAAVDFYGWIPRGLDLVVNWDTEAPARYHCQDFPGTDFFLGPETVFLDPDFLSGRQRWQPEENDRRPVVVAMGGADEFDLTGGILSELVPRLPPDTSFVAVVGAGYGHLDRLRDLAQGANGRLTIRQNITDMCREFLGARHVFGAGGLTAYELVATGTPCSLVACYDHQVHRCRHFADRGWVRYLGHCQNLGPVTLPAWTGPADGTDRFASGLDRVVTALEEKIQLRRSMRNGNSRSQGMAMANWDFR